MPLQFNDLVLGLLYGTENEKNSFIKKFAKDYVVYIGETFWYRLTGDRLFYYDLANAMADVAATVDAKTLVEETIGKLADDIRRREEGAS